MKVAVYTGSRNLYVDMATAVKSLLLNSDVDIVYFLIEDDTFPFKLPECVKTINVSNQTFFPADGPNMKSQYTYFAMMRATLCHLFPEIDKILSLDVDTIVDKDISNIWDIDLGDNYFAASKEAHRSYEGLLYTNIGVTLYNLKELRNGKADEVIETLNRRRYTYVEQDVFNYLCQGRILELSSSYNVNNWTAPTEDKKIIHYAGIKKYQGFPEYLKYQGIPFSDIRR